MLTFGMYHSSFFVGKARAYRVAVNAAFPGECACHSMLGVGEGQGVDEDEALLSLQSLLHPYATPAIQAWQQARYTALTYLRLLHCPSSKLCLSLTGAFAVCNTFCSQQ